MYMQRCMSVYNEDQEDSCSRNTNSTIDTTITTNVQLSLELRAVQTICLT